jgi:hypothetical protein
MADPLMLPAGATRSIETGFDMFVEKCNDGAETRASLELRWHALSDARKNTWLRLSRLCVVCVPHSNGILQISLILLLGMQIEI